MRNLLMAAVIGAGLLGAQAADYPSVWHTVADGGTVELTATVDANAKDSGDGNKLYSLVYVEKNGTVKVKIPEGATQPVLWTGFIATNGTVTLDLTEVAARGLPFQMRGTMAASLVAKSGEMNRGHVVVKGVDHLDVGSKSEQLYFAAPDVTFQNAEGETVDGTLSFFGSNLLMEAPTSCPFTFKDKPTISLMQPEGLASHYVDGTLYVTNYSLRLVGLNTIRSDIEICVSNSCSLATYYTYAPTNTIPLPPKTTTTGFFWGLWGLNDVHEVPNNICLADSGSFLQTSLRTASFTGSISGPGYVKATPPFDGSTTQRTQFADLGGLEGTFEVAPTYTSGKSAYVCRTIVLHGTPPQKMKISGTNCVVVVDGKAEPATYEVESLQGTSYDVMLPRLTIGANVTLNVGKMNGGTLLVDGAGALDLQEMKSGASLSVTGSTTVVCGPSVFARREAGPEAATIYFTTPDGRVDLSTYPAAEGPVLVPHGATVISTTNETSATVELTEGRVALLSPGSGWDVTNNLALWIDPSDSGKMTQVEVKEGVPTTAGARTGTQMEPVGLKTISVKGEDGANHPYPFVETFASVRAGIPYYLYNGRQYVGNASNPTNEYYQSVYMYMVTNPASTKGLSYLTGGNSTTRRLVFDNGTQMGRNGNTAIPRTWRSATLVFGSQDGGGAGLFADSKKYLGRVKGKGNPILSNDTCRVWLNGVEVDPTTATFSGGWDIVTIQPKSDFRDSPLNGIGYSAAYTGTGVDGGGQRYGEILIHTVEPTEEQRIALESHLAKKWHVANYAVNLPAPVLNVAGQGMLEISDDLALAGTATNITIAGSGEVTATARLAVPKFDAAFEGSIGFGFSPWTFTVCPAEAVVDDVIDVAPAKIRLMESTEVETALRGKVADGDFRLVSCGGFEGETTWTRTGDEKFAAARLVVDENGVVLHVANGGTLLLFR